MIICLLETRQLLIPVLSEGDLQCFAPHSPICGRRFLRATVQGDLVVPPAQTAMVCVKDSSIAQYISFAVVGLSSWKKLPTTCDMNSLLEDHSLQLWFHVVRSGCPLIIYLVVALNEFAITFT